MMTVFLFYRSISEAWMTAVLFVGCIVLYWLSVPLCHANRTKCGAADIGTEKERGKRHEASTD